MFTAYPSSQVQLTQILETAERISTTWAEVFYQDAMADAIIGAAFCAGLIFILGLIAAWIFRK